MKKSVIAIILFVYPISVLMSQENSEQSVSSTDSTMDEIVITANRRETILSETPDIVQVITADDISEMNPASMGELMEYTTGLSVETGTGSGLPDRSIISLNGLPANYTKVLVDGVPLITEHIHTGQNLEFINPAIIERIEIIRGAASAQYGTDAIGGIVNIITKKKSDTTYARLSGYTGSYDTFGGNINLILPYENTHLNTFLAWEQSAGYPLLAPAHRIDNTGYKRLQMTNRLDFDISEDIDVFASIESVENAMDWAGDTAYSHLFAPSAGITNRITDELDVTAKAAYSRWQSEVSNEKNVAFTPEIYSTYLMGEEHVFTGGVDYKWNQFERSALLEHEQVSYGGFFQYEWFPSEKYNLMAAMRFDRVEDIGTAISPKLAMLISPNRNINLRGSLGMGFHAPTLQELYEEGYGHGGAALRFGNPDLDPEYSYTATGGIEFMNRKNLQVSMYGFLNYIQDMIVPVYEGPWIVDPTKDVWRRQNIKNAVVYGLELNTRFIPRDNMKIDFGYTYTANRDEDTGHQLPYSPGSSLYAKYHSRHDISRGMDLDFFLGARMVFDREAWNWKPDPSLPTSPDGLTTPLEDYIKLDAGVSLFFGKEKEYEAYLKLYNLLGEDIENLDDVYTVIDGEPVWQIGMTWNMNF